MGFLRARVVGVMALGRNEVRFTCLRVAADKRNGLGALALDELAQRDALEESIHGGIQLFPEVVSHAAMAVVAVLAPAALRRVDGLLDRADDVGNRHLGRVAGEVIAAARAPHALDQRAAAQLAEKLLEVRKRDLLALADPGKGDRARGAMERQIEHRGHRETSFGRESHGVLGSGSKRAIGIPSDSLKYIK